MSFIEIQHTNPGAVTKRLDRWEKVFGSNLIVETIEKQMDITYAAVYKMAPYKTGYLRSTIRVSSGKDFSQIGISAYYAVYHHLGVRGRPADPFWKTNIASLSIETIIVIRNLFTQMF